MKWYQDLIIHSRAEKGIAELMIRQYPWLANAYDEFERDSTWVGASARWKKMVYPYNYTSYVVYFGALRGNMRCLVLMRRYVRRKVAATLA